MKHILSLKWKNLLPMFMRSTVPLHNGERERARPNDVQSGGGELTPHNTLFVPVAKYRSLFRKEWFVPIALTE